MSRQQGCLRRGFRIGCGLMMLLAVAAVAVVLYGRWSVREAPESEDSAAARSTAIAKADELERRLRAGQRFETQFTEEELTLLARRYVERHRIEGDATVTLPDDDLEVSFRTTVHQIERFVRREELPEWLRGDVWGTVRLRLSVTDGVPFAGLEQITLYGLPVPLTLLGSAADENWLDRLDSDSQAVVRRIRSLTIQDRTLHVSTG